MRREWQPPLVFLPGEFHGQRSLVGYSPWSHKVLDTTEWLIHTMYNQGFPGGLVVKNLPANSGDLDLIPGSGSFPREGNGKPLQYSCLENPMDRGTWWATFHRIARESDLTWRLNNHENVCPRHFAFWLKTPATKVASI